MGIHTNQITVAEAFLDLLASRGLKTETAKSFYAEAALEFQKTHDLTHRGAYKRDVSFATLETYDVESQKVVTRKVVGAAVHYGYTIDGIKAYGPGAKISIIFGSEDRVVGYIDALRRHKPMRTVALMHPEKAVEQYISYGEPKTLLRSGGGNVKAIIIDTVDLVYYLKAASKNQDEIRPHYLLGGRFICEDPMGKKDRIVKFEWLEDAVAN